MYQKPIHQAQKRREFLTSHCFNTIKIMMFIFALPAGNELQHRFNAIEGGLDIKIYFNGMACKNCTIRSQCTRSKKDPRRMRRWIHEADMEKMEALLKATPDAMLQRKQTVEHPLVRSFAFEEETALEAEKVDLLYRLSDIDDREDKLNQFKSMLALTGDDLVESVILAFSDGFGISVDGKDDLREDFKLLNAGSEHFCLCEVKGINKGVKREHINQADSHRERSGFGEKFPSLLIANTHIKNARSVEEKDQEIASEQILHAYRMNVLILRIIDLLGLLRLKLNDKISTKELVTLLIENKGWLRIENESYRIIDGQPSDEQS